MKTSGAPEKGDLVRYEWAFDDSQYRTTALVVGEHGIAVKLLIFGLWRENKYNPKKHRIEKTKTWEMTVPRTECKILRTRQGDAIVKNL